MGDENPPDVSRRHVGWLLALLLRGCGLRKVPVVSYDTMGGRRRGSKTKKNHPTCQNDTLGVWLVDLEGEWVEKDIHRVIGHDGWSASRV